MTLPNFLVIGAMKAGTSSLYYALRQHPEIYLSPIKEPHFFSFMGESEPPEPHIVTRLEKYRALFADRGQERAAGECSPSYLPNPLAAARIHELIPAAKLIAMLRHPVERAFSHYQHQVQIGDETDSSFLSAMEKNRSYRKANGEAWRSYREQGLYGAHVERYRQLFASEQLKIVLYDDYRDDPQGVLQEIFRFLEVADPDFQVELPWLGRSGKPRSRMLYDFLQHPPSLVTKLARAFPASLRVRVKAAVHNRNLVQSKLGENERRELVGYYREDIAKLQSLLGRDLSHWLR